MVGSGGWQDARLLEHVLDGYLGRAGLVNSGGAGGADRMGARWAPKRGIGTLILEPDYKNRRHPYRHRDRLIAEACDELVAFWDGRSSGTRYTMDYARRLGRPVTVVKPGHRL